MVFNTGGTTERMRINSSGLVGIGTAAPTRTLTVIGAVGNQFVASHTQANDTAKYGTYAVSHYHNAEQDVAGVAVLSNGTDNIVYLGGGVSELNAATVLAFHTGANDATTGGTERMRIAASGDVNIGSQASNTNAGRYFDIYNTGADAGTFATMRLITQQVPSTTTTSADFAKYKSGGLLINNNDPHANVHTAFSVGSSERMRITSAGNVGIGITNPAAPLDVPGAAYLNQVVGGRTNSAGNFHLDATGSGAIYLNWISGSGGVAVGNGAGAVGVITASAFNVSDRNEKENIEYFSEGLNKILQLKPAKFNFIGKENTESGLIAQDVQEVIPEMLGSYTKVDAEEPTLTLSNTMLLPYLINAIKEQQTTIEALEARITALEG
tara:strand:- start:35 stop:1180 length:1146 start_codon:yes stop_codon:yes gene_type:complete